MYDMLAFDRIAIETWRPHQSICYARTQVGYFASQKPHLDHDILTTEAFGVYRYPQATGDIGFSSLNVGARLDIGVAPDGKGWGVSLIKQQNGTGHIGLTQKRRKSYMKLLVGLLQKGLLRH